jgi:type I restriction enzyme S subunit
MSESTPLPQGRAISNFDEVLKYIQPGPYIVSSTDYPEFESTPVLTPGKSFILGFTTEIFGIFSDTPAIIFDDFTTNRKFVQFKFKLKSSALKILKSRTESVLLKYVFYFMQIVKVNTDSHKRYWIPDYSKRSILLPPLPEQENIVAKIEGQKPVELGRPA